eukprot:TRINITY_DN48743_c0_g1_i1.p1 TRINITY_DN48743_c0_g1~~TRINITY_DN48743_c0_g1_i1.p1  ORF type:complete len:267 (+),score=58.37 TRINITY_DN48743_c0_g1_i1:41-841(+)
MELAFGPYDEELQNRVFLEGYSFFPEIDFAQDVDIDCCSSSQLPDVRASSSDASPGRSRDQVAVRASFPEVPYISPAEVAEWLADFCEETMLYAGLSRSAGPALSATPFEACGSPASDEEPPEMPPKRVATFPDLSRAMSSVLPTKYTFIHFSSESQYLGRTSDDPSAEDEQFPEERFTRSFSAPAVLSVKADPPAHDSRNCKPCLYYYSKADGCRRGDACEFCHLCPRGAAQQLKREKRRKHRAEAKAAEGLPPAFELWCKERSH